MRAFRMLRRLEYLIETGQLFSCFPAVSSARCHRQANTHPFSLFNPGNSFIFVHLMELNAY